MNLRRMANLLGRGNFGQENTEVGAKNEDVMVKEISSTLKRNHLCSSGMVQKVSRGQKHHP